MQINFRFIIRRCSWALKSNAILSNSLWISQISQLTYIIEESSSRASLWFCIWLSCFSRSVFHATSKSRQSQFFSSCESDRLRLEAESVMSKSSVVSASSIMSKSSITFSFSMFFFVTFSSSMIMSRSSMINFFEMKSNVDRVFVINALIKIVMIMFDVSELKFENASSNFRLEKNDLLCNKSSLRNFWIVILFVSNRSSITRVQFVAFDKIAREMSFLEFRSRYIIVNFNLCKIFFMKYSARAHFLIVLSVCRLKSLKTRELNLHRSTIWFMTSSVIFWRFRACRIIDIMTRYSFLKSLNFLWNFFHEQSFFIQIHIFSIIFFMRICLCVQ